MQSILAINLTNNKDYVRNNNFYFYVDNRFLNDNRIFNLLKGSL